MGTAISGATTISFVPEIYHTEFPLHGITLSYVEEFIEAHGGRQAFEGWTADDVCQKIVRTAAVFVRGSIADHPASCIPGGKEGGRVRVFRR